MKKLLPLAAVFSLFGCQLADLEGTLCNADGTCGDGYWCHRVENRCKTGEAPVPDVVRLNSTTPASPAKDTSVTVRGVAPADTTVRVFLSADCSGTPVLEAPSAQFNSLGFSTSVTVNTTTSFTATATNAAGYTSPCSAPVEYVSDTLPPARPEITAATPQNPAQTTRPGLIGNAEAGATVRIFRGNACGATAIASGPQSDFIAGGILVDADSNAATVYTALAEDGAKNTSDCSTPFTFVNDTIAPSAATVTSTEPAIAARTTSIKVRGSTPEAAGTVKVYAAGCDGPLLATGTAAEFSSDGLAVTLTENQQTAFAASFSDAAGNTAPCSAPGASFHADYPPTLSSTPASPNASRRPKIQGTIEPNLTVEVWANGSCSGPPLGTFDAVGLAAGTAEQFVSPETTTPFSARSFNGTAASSCAVLNYRTSCNASGIPTGICTHGCSSGGVPSAPDDVFPNGMVACAGSVTWPNRLQLCRPNASSASAADWANGRGAVIPRHHYWTNDDLRYSGTGSGACSANDNLTGTPCTNRFGAPTPMRVCTPSTTDPSANACNWLNCAYNGGADNAYFGGCQDNDTAGSLCGPFANGCADGTSEQRFGPYMFGCAGAVAWSNRGSLCAGNCRVCSAADWVAARGAGVPAYHYWTSDSLTYAGTGSGECGAYNTGAGFSCGANPMLVCTSTDSNTTSANTQDPSGNTCNWINCGFNRNSWRLGGIGFVRDNDRMGGCSSGTAGTLCCCPG